MLRNNAYIINPEEGEVVWIYYDRANNQRKYAINLQPKEQHMHSDVFNAVIATSKNMDKNYPGDYFLSDGTLPLPDGVTPRPTKIICNQIISIPKIEVEESLGKLPDEDLRKIQRLAAEGIGVSLESDT